MTFRLIYYLCAISKSKCYWCTSLLILIVIIVRIWFVLINVIGSITISHLQLYNVIFNHCIFNNYYDTFVGFVSEKHWNIFWNILLGSRIWIVLWIISTASWLMHARYDFWFAEKFMLNMRIKPFIFVWF